MRSYRIFEIAENKHISKKSSGGISSMHLTRKAALHLFLISWAVYFCTYMGRLNYPAVMSELIGVHMTKSAAGWISTVFLVAYALGQLINGALAEKVSSRNMVAFGIVGAGVLNLVFPLTDSYILWLILRFLTGLCMSMVWPSMLKSMITLMQEKDKLAYTVHISSSIAAGTLGSYLSSSALLKWFSWKETFFLPGFLLILIGSLWFILFPLIVKHKENDPSAAPAMTVENENGTVDASDPLADPDHPLPLKRLWIMPCLLWALIPVILHGVIKDGVTSWVPTYLSEVFHITASFSALLTILLPIINLSGAYLAAFAYRAFKKNVFTASSLFFSLSAIFFLVLLFNRDSLILSLVCFSIVTSGMMAVNVLMITLLPLSFERVGRSATVSGGLNAIAYLGSAAGSGLIGVLSERSGWEAAILSWLVIMLASALITLISRKLQPNFKARI